MKVTGQQPTHLSELGAGKTRDKGESKLLDRSRQAPESDAVANHASTTANRIREALRSEPDIRADRVAEVKQKIRDGKYQVEPEKLAEEMLLASLREDLEKS